MDVSLEGLLVLKSADEQQLLAKVGQRREHLTELHRIAFTAGPPFLAMETVAGKQHSQPHWRLSGRLRAPRHASPHIKRLHPWQRHRHAHPPQQRTPRD